jgi:hypothetical protein
MARLPAFAQSARECRVGQTDASAIDIGWASGQTFGGFADYADCAGNLVSSQKPQRLRKVASHGTSRAEQLTNLSFRARGDHLKNSVGIPRRENDPPGSNPPANGKDSTGAIEHDQVERESQ